MRTTEKQLRDSKPTIDEMRLDLAEQEAITLQTSDVIELLLNGFEGLENMPDIEIRDEWNMLFGESEKSS
tara:strand:- start:3272 stop:3481 length:210 start_codon:yes stop_codon:yes gene_type:complete